MARIKFGFACDSSKLSGQIDSVLKIADLVNQFLFSRVTSGENPAVCERPNRLHIHLAAGGNGFDKINVHIIDQALKVRFFPVRQRASRSFLYP